MLQLLLDIGERARRVPWLGPRLKPLADRALDLLLRLGKLGGVRALRAFPHGRLLPRNTGSNYLGQRVITASRKVELAPPALVELARSRIPSSS